MVIDLKDIDWPHEIGRTNQSLLEIPGQVGTVKESKITKRQEENDAVRIVRVVLLLRHVGGTVRVLLGLTRGRSDELLLGRETSQEKRRGALAFLCFQRNGIPGSKDLPLPLGRCDVILQPSHEGTILLRQPVVVDPHHLDLLGEISDTAIVVAVKMGDD